ncbi:MAG: Hsp20/alpha crystallin family protein [Methanolobus sp.]|nr:Hsp20/alpha crystallin family protein [Methanolobus sp.]
MVSVSKDNQKNEDYQDRIKKLEKRIEELENEKDSGIVEGVVNQFIPGFGGIVKSLEKSSPEFRKRIAETDAEIKHRLETGWSSTPKVDYNMSVRPLVSERKEAKPKAVKMEPKVRVEIPPERETIIDVFEEKDHIFVIAELPGVEEEDIETKLQGGTLEISAGKYSKIVKLPPAAKSIAWKTYRYGILQLWIEREMQDGTENCG